MQLGLGHRHTPSMRGECRAYRKPRHTRLETRFGTAGQWCATGISALLDCHTKNEKPRLAVEFSLSDTIRAAQAVRPKACLRNHAGLGMDQRDAAAQRHSFATAAVIVRLLLLRRCGDHRFGRDHQARDRRRVLQRIARRPDRCSSDLARCWSAGLSMPCESRRKWKLRFEFLASGSFSLRNPAAVERSRASENCGSTRLWEHPDG